MTVSEFVNQKYWPVVCNTISPKWRERSEQLIAMITEGLGVYPINAVPVEACEAWLNSLRTRYKSPVTPNRALLRAKQIFSAAQRWKYCTDNPMGSLRKKKEPVRKFVFLTEEQQSLLMHEACVKMKWYIIFARYTGARLGSLAKLEERDVRGDELIFWETKNSEDYAVSIHPALLPWVQRALTNSPTRRLLPQYNDSHSVSQLFRGLCKRLGIEGYRFHEFRHNVGTQLAAHGHNVKTIMAVLGHRNEKMNIHYTHVSRESVRQALINSI